MTPPSITTEWPTGHPDITLWVMGGDTPDTMRDFLISIVLLLQLIWDLRVFTQIKLLQDAGSKSGDFDLLGTYIYKLGTSAQDFGMASAVSILVLGITIALSWFYIRSLLREDAA